MCNLEIKSLIECCAMASANDKNGFIYDKPGELCKVGSLPIFTQASETPKAGLIKVYKTCSYNHIYNMQVWNILLFSVGRFTTSAPYTASKYYCMKLTLKIITLNSGTHTKLMVVGGDNAERQVQVINLSGDGKTCTTPDLYPNEKGTTGAFINGKAMVCGGVIATSPTDECYSYNKGVT